MATTFKHNGNTYTIIEGTDEVQLNQLGSGSTEIYLPKYAIFEDKQFRVVDIKPTPKGNYISVNVETDGRRKPKYESRWHETTVNIAGDDLYSSYNRREILKIHFHDNIRTIGEYAFYKFHKIKNIELPAELKVIERYSFYRCKELETLYLPNGLLSIGSFSFADCIHLKSILIPDSVTRIESYAFYNCSNLTKVVIGPGIKSIGECAFASDIGVKVKLKSVDIYADPFEVMIAPNAFPSSMVQVSYHNPNEYKQKNIASSKREELSTLISLLKSFSERKTSTSENYSSIFNNKSNDIEIERLINAVLVDRVITEKERAVILRKATSAGYDPDEVEILLDARLYEKQNAQNETEKPIKEQSATVKMEVKEVVVSAKEIPEQEINQSESEAKFPWGEKVWEPVKASLGKNNIALKAPKTNQNWIVFKLKSIDAQIALVYNPGKHIASVQLETLSGESVKSKLDSKIALTAEHHVIRNAEIEQSKRNKDKWVWAVRKNINKNSPEIIKWYTDVMIDIYRAIED